MNQDLLAEKKRGLQRANARLLMVSQEIANALEKKPSLLLLAQKQLQEKLQKNPPSLPHLKKWDQLLRNNALSEILALLRNADSEQIALLTCAPFAGNEFRLR